MHMLGDPCWAHLLVDVPPTKSNEGGSRAACWFRHFRWYVERRQQKVRENKAEELDGRRDGLVRS